MDQKLKGAIDLLREAREQLAIATSNADGMGCTDDGQMHHLLSRRIETWLLDSAP